jgi:signal transduction histidine kinase
VLLMPHIGPLNTKQSTYLGHIQDSGKHLLELINQILDLAKLETGKIELNLAAYSLREICQASLEITSEQAATKHLQTHFSMEPEAIILNADALRLKQIVINLLSNAIKFTPDGGSFGIEIVGSQDKKQILLTVWDSGIGIQAEDIPRLFQSFVQLDARLGRKYEGTGLGLALVRRLSELHGGSVSIESTPGQGSRFTVLLPWMQA